MAIVKADGYGHGLAEVVQTLQRITDWFGVANLWEAKTAKSVAPDSNILILSPLIPSERCEAVADRFHVTVSGKTEILEYQKAAHDCGRVAKLHIALDTGMGRMGAPVGQLDELLQAIENSEHCELCGIASHFPSADEDKAFTREQIEQFRKLIPANATCHIHLANSAGLLGFHNDIDFATLARPGLALYGVSPLAEFQQSLQPVLTWKSRVTLVREMKRGDTISYGRTFSCPEDCRVATLSVGYGDGYPRSLTGSGADVLIQGQRCPLLGRVTMDQIVVDVSHLQQIEPGDEVVLLGSQGDESISANELAQKAATIPWEIFTGLTNRVDRVYSA